VAGLKDAVARHDLPFVIYNQGSIVHLQTVGTMHFTVDFNKIWQIPARLKEIKARKTVMEEMGAAYTAEGVITLAGSRLYTSAAHTEHTIDQAVAAFDRVFAGIEGARP
jgi:glutamate-1-semialdehyde 2,1-aminomutase